jgi:hypothetical protein
MKAVVFNSPKVSPFFNLNTIDFVQALTEPSTMGIGKSIFCLSFLIPRAIVA